MLFLRMLSHALQACLPAAVAAGWFAALGQRDRVRAIRNGTVVALLATWPAAYLFVHSTRQADWEAALAASAVAAIAWVLGRRVSVPNSALAATCALVVLRQAIVPRAVLWATLQSPSPDGTEQVLAAVLAAIVVAALWIGLARALPLRALRAATLVFAAMFLWQTAFYAFHRAAELGLVPWANTLDGLTEPYGPDGVYGMYLSVLTALVPATIGMLAAWREGVRRPLAFGATALALATAGAAVAAGRPVTGRMAADDNARAAVDRTSAGGSPAALTAVPHVLFRGSQMDATYGKLAITALDAPGRRKVATALGCERVAFGGAGGICLHAERGAQTAFTAILFNGAFRATKVVPLAGEPSRTRVSPDGRVGAWTVFVSGLPHSYANEGFSTSTHLIDMSTGNVLGNLEDFTTWRNGRRFKAPDFNFWGVTFTRDSNVFYATLQTGGAALLVRGDLALRKLTVIREGVECPSLSPDDRLIAYKKRAGRARTPWRLHVLDLATMIDRPVPGEARSIDDQVEWLDSSHILYAIERPGEPIRDVWMAPIDGTEGPRVFLPAAESPIVVPAALEQLIAR